MKCPLDDTTLVISERQGIEIDYCPKCRGVWLDRGELDKIIERTDGSSSTLTRGNAERSQLSSWNSEPDRHNSHQPKRCKRESFLSDLFDFDD